MVHPTAPGKLYLYARCLTCRGWIPMLELSPDEDLSTPSRSVPVIFRNVACPHCRARHNYPLLDLIRRRAPSTE
jgi:hypothetical protein